MSLVSVSGLTVDFPVGEGRTVRAVDDLSLTLPPGGALGIVGESGSGKSTVAAALLGLHRGTGAAVSGAVRVADVDVQSADESQLRRLRGGLAAMVFQDPLSSLDPYYAVGDQIAEVYRVHHDATRRAARARATEVLTRVGIPDAVRRARSRPHEFSGGMRQRVLIAMALACEPRLLIADEPTTALDVTVQAQILDLLHDLRAETGMGLLLVTHDLGVAAGNVDDLLVMRAGRAVERGPVSRVLGAPAEAYTASLLAAVPRIPAGAAGILSGAEQAVPAPGDEGRGAPTARPAFEAEARSADEARPASEAERRRRDAAAGRPRRDGEPLLELTDVTHEFRQRRTRTTAVEAVTLTLHEGEALGIVGESGSGKTTLGRLIVGLLEPTAGAIAHRGDPRTRIRRDVQMVFQDPASSLNPRRSIGDSIADPLRAAGTAEAEARARVTELLERVGLDPAAYHRYPHEFSGGQRQRVGIARALAPEPRLLVCDEPVSALDVTTQAQIIALLAELRRDLGLSLVFIAHDLAVVRQVSHRVAVMRRGAVVEEGPVDEVYANPAHPYTRALLAAVPDLDPRRAAERRRARRELATETAHAADGAPEQPVPQLAHTS
ncbi:ABC transporter ATP-binding protein [Streptomyces sp. NPDC051940]|uniref:ABC transporter ATP-binding protein n=1 Tax=Streptomyces sp. NPDC051940 TaxID=3155675 RepID=UPI003441AE5B